jgi:hypothetical protein
MFLRQEENSLLNLIQGKISVNVSIVRPFCFEDVSIVILEYLKRYLNYAIRYLIFHLQLKFPTNFYFPKKLANLLGYKNYSEYALELCMAKNPKNVDVFLENLSTKVKSLLQNEVEILLKYKKDEVNFISSCFFTKILNSLSPPSVKNLTYHSTVKSINPM